MSETAEEEVIGKIVLDKFFWAEPLSLGWALKYERVTNRKSLKNPDKMVVESDVWYLSSLLACIASYVDKKIHSQIKNSGEPYTPEEVLSEINVILRNLDKKFGYLKNIQSVSNS